MSTDISGNTKGKFAEARGVSQADGKDRVPGDSRVNFGSMCLRQKIERECPCQVASRKWILLLTGESHTRIGSKARGEQNLSCRKFGTVERDIFDWISPKVYEMPLEEEIFWKQYYIVRRSQLGTEGREALKVSALVRELPVLHHPHFYEEQPFTGPCYFR